jgi:hypothetical protein
MRMQEKLEAMAAQYESKAAALRMAVAEIDGVLMEDAKAGLNGKLGKAITMRNGNGHSGGPLKGYKYPAGTHWTQLPKNRRKVAALARKSARTQMAMRKGKTYTSTNGRSVPPSLKKQRQKSARLLEHFNASEPMPFPKNAKSNVFAPLIRHGYLERQGEGYVRTSKEFLA